MGEFADMEMSNSFESFVNHGYLEDDRGCEEDLDSQIIQTQNNIRNNKKVEVFKMNNLTFPLLTADDIELRVNTISEKGCSLLLFKNARVDMNILDDTVGAYNWKREHSRDNANCIISIWDEEKKQWIGKEDTGSESNTEKEKGLASDSFKRAAFNWGIGRELYTAPFIWISADKVNITKRSDGKYMTYDKFTVSKIETDNKAKKILHLEITDKYGNTVFTWDNNKPPVYEQEEPTEPDDIKDKPKQSSNSPLKCVGAGCNATITSQKSIDWYNAHPQAKVLCYNCSQAGKK